jgi:hypothetical protein
LIGLSTVTSTFQEDIFFNDYALSIICMINIWLLALGVAVTFAVLFCKTWRINKVILGSGGAFRKATIRPRDVLWPMAVLVSLNLVILVAWTIVAPLTWERPIFIDGKLGPYRGSCYNWMYEGSTEDSLFAAKVAFAALLCAVNLVR